MQKLKLEQLGRKSIEAFKNSEHIPLVVILDNIRSMHNVGSVFRTADSFNIEKIYLCGITPTPPHREIHKTALGATESVDWEYISDIKTLIEKFKTENVYLIGIEQVTNSIRLNEFPFDKNRQYAVILGNEVDGLNEIILPLLDVCLEIPQAGTKHSLNVSVCAGIVLWEAFRQLS